MKPITQEWINKAEGDWREAERANRVRKDPNHDSACFHAQQCAEKYLKARLAEANIVFSKTHDLPLLLGLVTKVEPAWAALQTALDNLNDYAVDYRYPGKSATKADAKQAIKDCRVVRRAVRTAFGLPV